MDNRGQVRALLMPAFYEKGAERGVPLTHEEEEAVIDIYMDRAEIGDYRGAIQAAVAKLRRLVEPDMLWPVRVAP